MRKLEDFLSTLCVLCTAVFLLAVALMVVAQTVAILKLDGELSYLLMNVISKPASVVSAVATVIALVLAYLRGQMSE